MGTVVRPLRGLSITCLLEDGPVQDLALHVIDISELESLCLEKQDRDDL